MKRYSGREATSEIIYARRKNINIEWCKADDVADLAERGLEYPIGHKNHCRFFMRNSECTCGYSDYQAELEQIVKTGGK